MQSRFRNLSSLFHSDAAAPGRRVENARSSDWAANLMSVFRRPRLDLGVRLF
jgi:hypothetical protein